MILYLLRNVKAWLVAGRLINTSNLIDVAYKLQLQLRVTFIEQQNARFWFVVIRVCFNIKSFPCRSNV